MVGQRKTLLIMFCLVQYNIQQNKDRYFADNIIIIIHYRPHTSEYNTLDIKIIKLYYMKVIVLTVGFLYIWLLIYARIRSSRTKLFRRHIKHLNDFSHNLEKYFW